MNNTIEIPAEAGQSTIAQLAYQLWEESGCPPGMDVEFWLRAEAQLSKRQTHNADPTPVTIPLGSSYGTSHDGSMPPTAALSARRTTSKLLKKRAKN